MLNSIKERLIKIKNKVIEYKYSKIIILLLVISLIIFSFIKLKLFFIIVTLLLVLAIIMFKKFIINIPQKILLILLAIFIIIYIVILFNFGIKSNTGVTKQLNYQKELSFNDGNSKYNIDITTEKTRYVIRFTVTYDNSMLPKDFLWYPVESRNYFEQGVDVLNLDRLTCYIYPENDIANYKYAGQLGPSYYYDSSNNPILHPYSTSTVKYTFSNINSLKEMKKHNNIGVYKYTVSDVGIKNVKIDETQSSADGTTFKATSYTERHEDAYKFNKILFNTTIDWENIFIELGI